MKKLWLRTYTTVPIWDLGVVELWVQVGCKLGYKQDQIWVLNNNKNSGDGKTPKCHAVSRKKFWVLRESVSRWMFALAWYWVILVSSEVNCYKKKVPHLTFEQKQKFWWRQNSQRSRSFKEKNLGAPRVCISLDVCVSMDPDKKKWEWYFSSRWIGPDTGARLCLLWVQGVE